MISLTPRFEFSDDLKVLQHSNGTPTGHLFNTIQPKVGKLFCDKLSLTLDISNSELSELERRTNQLLDKGLGWRSSSRLYNYGARLLGLSGLAEDSHSNLRVDFGAKRAGVRNFRMELNPHKANLQLIAQICQAMVPDFGERVLTGGRITRMDLAVDVSPLSFANLGISVSQYSASQAFWGRDGVLETLYFGTKKQFKVYDKLRESTPDYMVGKSAPKPTVLRFVTNQDRLWGLLS